MLACFVDTCLRGFARFEEVERERMGVLWGVGGAVGFAVFVAGEEDGCSGAAEALEETVVV